MVVYGEGRYLCAEHGDQSRRPGGVTLSTSGEFENHCPCCGSRLDWQLVDEDARLDPAAAMPRARSPRSTTRRPGRGRRVDRRSRCATTTSTARDAPGHAVLRCRRDVPLGARARRAAAGLRGRRPDARLRARRTTWRRPTCWRSRPSSRALRAAGRRTTSAPGSRSASARWRRHVARHSGCGPSVTGGYRLGDVRHVVASPERAGRRARLPGVDRPGRRAGQRSRGSRCGTATSPAREEQVLHEQGAGRPAARAPDGATAPGAGAGDSSSQGTNGSQIRSTSALLICETSATATIAAAAAHEQQRGPHVDRHASPRHRPWRDRPAQAAARR